MKRSSIEFMIGWLDALRRNDLETLTARLDPNVVWQGLREEWACHGPEEVVDMFTGQRDAYGEIDRVDRRPPRRPACLRR